MKSSFNSVMGLGLPKPMLDGDTPSVGPRHPPRDPGHGLPASTPHQLRGTEGESVRAEMFGPFAHGPGQRILSPRSNRVGALFQTSVEGGSPLHLIFAEEQQGNRFAAPNPDDDDLSPDTGTFKGYPGSMYIAPGELGELPALPAPFYCYKGPVWGVSLKVTLTGGVYFYSGHYTVTEFYIDGGR